VLTLALLMLMFQLVLVLMLMLHRCAFCLRDGVHLHGRREL
jgi:hypothetical protein